MATRRRHLRAWKPQALALLRMANLPLQCQVKMDILERQVTDILVQSPRLTARPLVLMDTCGREQPPRRRARENEDDEMEEIPVEPDEATALRARRRLPPPRSEISNNSELARAAREKAAGSRPSTGTAPSGDRACPRPRPLVGTAVKAAPAVPVTVVSRFRSDLGALGNFFLTVVF